MGRLLALLTTLIMMLSGCALKSQVLDFSSNQASAATIQIPGELKVLTLDGIEAKLPLLRSSTYFISVDKGEHTLEFVYEEEWGGGEQAEYRNSDIQQVEFEVQAGENHSLEYEKPQGRKSLEKADNYLAQFTAWIQTPAGDKIYSAGLESQQSDDDRVVIKMSKPASDKESSKRAGIKESPTEYDENTESNLQVLKSLWKGSSQEDRDAFMLWLVNER